MKLPKVVRVHIDTEFTDFVNRDLISIGAAADNGEYFYGQNADYIKAWASDWVKQNVLPYCEADKWMKRASLSAALWTWIEGLDCDFVIICADYDGDYELLFDLFGQEKHPKMIEWQNIHHVIYKTVDTQTMSDGTGQDYHRIVEAVKKCFFEEFMNYFFETKEIQHHAGSDAKANRRAWNAVVREFGMPI